MSLFTVNFNTIKPHNPVVIECELIFGIFVNQSFVFCICKGYGKWFLFIVAINNSYRRKPQLLK